MDESPVMLLFAVGGIVLGSTLFVRGLLAYRRDRFVSSVATSSLDGIAAGEVRVSGVVKALDQTLVSPLQSRACVWYRARVETTDDRRQVLLDQEHAVQFAISDDHGTIRVVPNGARWEIGTAFDESTGRLGDEPVGLERRRGPGYAMAIPDDPAEMTEMQRQAAIDALLTVQGPVTWPEADPGRGLDTGPWVTGVAVGPGAGRRYQEARLEPGDTVTIVGQALPWSDVREGLAEWAASGELERAIAFDIAEARANGLLAASPEAAWGNAAIPGFGIGRPTRTPDLDEGTPSPLIAEESARRDTMERFELPDDMLVLARGSGGTLAVYRGTPQEATRHHDPTFALGLVGAGMAVFSALALGVMLSL